MAFRRGLTGAAIVFGGGLTWRSLSGLALVAPQGAGSGVIIATSVMILAHLWPALVMVAVLSLALFTSYASRIGRRLALADLAADHAQLQAERERLQERINQASAAFQAKDQEIERARRYIEDDLRRARAAVDQDRQALEDRQAYFERIEGELKGAREHIRRLKKKLPQTD